MKAPFIFLFLLSVMHAQAQNVAQKPVQHNSIVLPLYEVKYINKVIQTDPVDVWMDKAISVGDTIKLSDENLSLDKATLGYKMGPDIEELELHGNLVTPKFKEFVEAVSSEKGALMFLDINNCVDKKGNPVKNECSYRFRFY